VTYTPNAGYVGPDSFTFSVDDGRGGTAQATVTITVGEAPNQAPSADAQALETAYETALPITLTGSDPDGDELTYQIVTPPANGALSGTAPAVTYTPNAGYVGPDSFTFSVDDGRGGTAQATVTITVGEAPNQAPSAAAQALETAYETALPITLTGSDPDGDELTYQIVTPPANGALSGTAPAVTYTPNAGYVGPDSFTFSVDDGRGGTAQATVTITVGEAPNQAPSAAAQALETAYETALPITLTGSDPDGDELTYQIVTPPANGALSGTAPAVTYTPNAGYVGPDSFTFSVDDGRGGTAQATVTITVGEAPNQAPSAAAQALETAYETALPITLTGSDPDGDELTYQIVTPPANGTLSGTAPTVTYTPNAGYVGPDSFTFSVDDGRGGTAQATVTITVGEAPNQAPSADAQALETAYETALPITLTGSDPDGDELTYQIVTPPANGALSGTAPAVTYTPNAGYVGPDSFTFSVDDGRGGTAQATVTITVGEAPNQAPSADAQALETAYETALPITLTGSDPDGDELTYQIVTPPANGALSGTAPAVTYTPNAGYVGPDSFTFSVDDGRGGTAQATVTITVGEAPNQAPSADAQALETAYETALPITLTGSDPDGDELTYQIVTPPANGALSGTAPTVTYTPNAGYVGPDSFTFSVDDGRGGTAQATVTITVGEAPNQAPSADAQALESV
jgi:large repetitive protein